MPCYRQGGCGPYENQSCSECPASKPEYVRQSSKEITVPQYGVTFSRPLGIPDPIPTRYLKGQSEETKRKVITEWLLAHKKENGKYLICIKPDYIRDNLAEHGLNGRKFAIAMEFMKDVDTHPSLYKRISDIVNQTNSMLSRKDDKESPRFVKTVANYVCIENMPKIDPITCPYAQLEELYTLVQILDNTCECIFMEILTFFRNESKYPETNTDMTDRLKELAKQLLQNYSFSRNQTVKLLSDIGCSSAEAVFAVTEAMRSM